MSNHDDQQRRADSASRVKRSAAEQQQAVIEAALELAYAERPAREDVVDVAKASTVQATDFSR